MDARLVGCLCGHTNGMREISAGSWPDTRRSWDLGCRGGKKMARS